MPDAQARIADEWMKGYTGHDAQDVDVGDDGGAGAALYAGMGG